MLLPALFDGCSPENTVTGGVPDPLDPTPAATSPYQVCFDIALPVMESASRASSDYDDGRTNPYENFIDLEGGNYRFYAFTLDNKYIATLNVEEIKALESPNTESKTYQMLANFDHDPGVDFKIVALANWPSYFGDAYPEFMQPGMPIGNLVGDLTANFTVNPLAAPGADNLIPMFGVKEFHDVDFSPMRYWLGTIHLIRAISKIEVSVSAAASPKIHFKTLKLHNYYTVGVAMPRLANYVQADYVDPGFAIDYLRPATMRTGTANPMHGTLDLTPYLVDDKVTFYLPEIRLTEDYDLMGVPYDYATRTRMTATFTMEGNDSFDTNQQYDIEFKFYDPTQALKVGATQYDYFDIMRNYFYRFSVKSLAGAEISLYADVVPYTEVTLKPTFGFSDGDEDDEDYPIGCGCIENGGTCTCAPDCGCCDHS